MRWVLSLQPSYFVDFLLNFQTFEIIELWFVTLKGAVDIVFTTSRIGLFGLKFREFTLVQCTEALQTTLKRLMTNIVLMLMELQRVLNASNWSLICIKSRRVAHN